MALIGEREGSKARRLVRWGALGAVIIAVAALGFAVHYLPVPDSRDGTRACPLLTGDSAPGVSSLKGKLYFVRGETHSPVNTVYELNLAKGKERRLSASGLRQAFPSLSPDGKQLLFERAHKELVTMPAGGGESRTLTTASSRDYLHGSWSPNGDLVVYEATAESGTFGLFVFDIASSATRQLVSPKRAHRPAWSPIDERIAFMSATSSESWNIWIVSSEGSDARPLTTGKFKEAEPSWSPDGKRITFSSDRSGHEEIWLMAADGSDLCQLTAHHDHGVYEATWSPDGRFVAYVVETTDGGDIWVSDLANGATWQLTDSPAGMLDEGPSWAP